VKARLAEQERDRLVDSQPDFSDEGQLRVGDTVKAKLTEFKTAKEGVIFAINEDGSYEVKLFTNKYTVQAGEIKVSEEDTTDKEDEPVAKEED
jgi:hypothetical protein